MSRRDLEAPTEEAARTHWLERHGWTAALLLVALGFAIRLRGLSEYWLNPDEGIYYSTLTSASFGQFWAEVVENAHPPAFYLLLRGVGLLTWDFVWLRVPSLLFGTAAIWMFWLVGRELGGKGRAGVLTGLVAAGLVAFSADAIAFSQVLRPYMLLLALLSAALFYLLRYRSKPTDRTLMLYVVFVSLAMLSHYSAALAFGVFLVVVVYYHSAEEVDARSWKRLAAAQAIPAVLLGVLYLQHLRRALGSGLMDQAFRQGGWLNDWLVASPADAWHSFVTFHNLYLPTDFQGRAALLLLAAIVASALSRDRLVWVLAGGALAVALLASFLGVYPFGPSRHNAWLLVFTLPAVAWLVGRIIERGRLAVLAAVGVVAPALLFGGAMERSLGAYPLRGNAAEERAIRRRDLASLVVEQLDPAAEPRIILMSFQTYNLLMPLYAADRQNVTASSDVYLFSFSYGSRNVVVSGQWDWLGLDDVRQVVQSLPMRLPEVAPDPPGRVLLVAGGWGSSIFGSTSELEERGAIVESAVVLGSDPLGRPLLRLVAFVLDREALVAPS